MLDSLERVWRVVERFVRRLCAIFFLLAFCLGLKGMWRG